MTPALIVLLLNVTIIPLLLFVIFYAVEQTYRKTQKICSDLELLEIFVEHGNALSTKQLGGYSNLSNAQVKIRMQAWTNKGAMRTLYANDGSTVFQLKTRMPKDVKRYDIGLLNNRQIVEAVVAQIDGFEISAAHLVYIFDITVREAAKILRKLTRENLLIAHYSGSFQRVYVAHLAKSAAEKSGGKYERIQLPQPKENDSRIEINDADLLKLAIDHEGRLTPTIICIEKKISLDDAQLLLDQLYDKGAFNIEVDDESGTIEYWLRDSKLYRK